jgi:hypothetical protein
MGALLNGFGRNLAELWRAQESRNRKWHIKEAERPSKSQGLLGQCALTTVAILVTLATLNL